MSNIRGYRSHLHTGTCRTRFSIKMYNMMLSLGPQAPERDQQ